MRDFYPFTTALLIDGDEAVVDTRIGHLCGYTCLPVSAIPPHWAGNYNADALQYLNVHGGLTYARVHGSECVFGFDCGHLDDEKNEKLRDPAHVMALAKQMRDQITAYAARYEEWTVAGRDRRIAIVEEIRIRGDENNVLGFGALIGCLAGAPEFGSKEQS